MITLLDYHSSIIRDFTDEQFVLHVKLIEDILAENNFEDTGIAALLQNYLSILNKIDLSNSSNITEIKLSKNETFLYDLSIEIARLCYKHSCEVGDSNDWESEF